MELSGVRAGNVRPWMESEILKNDGILREIYAVKRTRIDGQRTDYPLPTMCAMLAIGVGGYQAWERGGFPDRIRLTDAQIFTPIQAIHVALKDAYSSPCMVRELRDQGFQAGKERVERLLRQSSIRTRHMRRSKAMTDSKHTLPLPFAGRLGTAHRPRSRIESGLSR